MPNWWTLDQALFWVATRDGDLVAAADARPRRTTRKDRLAWLHFILGDEEGGLPGELRMTPDEAADKLLDAIADGIVAAKFYSSATEAAEPSWFNDAAIEYETRGEDCIARLRWKGKDLLPSDLPNNSYAVVSVSDLKNTFPDMLAEMERDSARKEAPVYEVSKSTQEDAPPQPLPSIQATTKRKRGTPSLEQYDAQYFPEIDRLMLSGEALSVARAAAIIVQKAGPHLKGAGTDENKAKRLARRYIRHKDEKAGE